MPLKKGFKPEIVSGNVRELVSSGYKPKQAVAIALSQSRKFKKMAEGGMVEEGDMEIPRDLYELNADSQQPETVANPEEHDESMRFADALRKEAESRDGSMAMMADGGLVEDDMDMEETEPEMQPSPAPEDTVRAPDVTDEAMQAIADRKKRRRYGM